jgi:hypothetical protein
MTTTPNASRAERTLVTALILLFVLPLIATPFVKHGRRLSGVTVPTEHVPLSVASLASGAFQQSVANRFNERFAGRPMLIRATNELWFRVFRETSTSTSHLALGIDDTLFEKAYLREYFRERVEKQTLRPWVQQLQRFHELCKSRGVALVLIVSPSKASIYPELAPPKWQRFLDPRTRGSAQLLELLSEHGVPAVDASALLMREKTTNPPAAPLFARGSTHWNARGAWLAGNELATRWREQGKNVQPLEVASSAESDKPVGEDADLLHLLNLLSKWRYPIEQLIIAPRSTPPEQQLKLAAVGGSFSRALLRQLSSSSQFSEASLFFYYKLHKLSFAGGEVKVLRKPASPIDFEREVFSADCLLLEINEASAIYPEHHLSHFVADALAASQPTR